MRKIPHKYIIANPRMRVKRSRERFPYPVKDFHMECVNEKGKAFRHACGREAKMGV